MERFINGKNLLIDMSKYNLINYVKAGITSLALITMLTSYCNPGIASVKDLNKDGQEDITVKVGNMNIGWMNRDNGEYDILPTISKDSTKSLDKKLE